MANYFVINNKFKPYSFDELIRPYQIYGQAYKEQEALLDDAMANEFSPDNLDATQDKAAYDMYNAADQGLRAVSDELATRGLSPQLRNRLRNTAKEYKKTMTSLTNAQEQLNAERDRRAKLGPDYVYQQGDLRIGDFLGGNRPNDKGTSLSKITKDIAAEFEARAKTISKDTWNRVLDKNGKVVGGYYDVTTEAGLTNAQLDTILYSDDTTWNSIMRDPSISNEEKKRLEGFRKAIESTKSAIDYNGYSDTSEIDKAIEIGAHAGLGSTVHKYQTEPGYNPLGWTQFYANRDAKRTELEAKYPQYQFDKDGNLKRGENGEILLSPGWKYENGKWVGPGGQTANGTGSSSSSSSGSGGGSTRNPRKPDLGVTIYDKDGKVMGDYASADKALTPNKSSLMEGMTEVTSTEEVIESKDGPKSVDSLTDKSYRIIASKVGINVSPTGEISQELKETILEEAKNLDIDIRVSTKRNRDGSIKEQTLATVDRKSIITTGSGSPEEDNGDGQYNENAEPV